MKGEKKLSLNRELAVLIASTRRKRRPFSLVEIGEAVEAARKELGSYAEVGRRIGVSGKMLGQFARVFDLSDSLKELVARRKIDSVDAVAHIARLADSDQEALAAAISDNGWFTEDIRAFCELRKRDTSSNPSLLVDKVNSARSKKEFVFEFVARGDLDEAKLRCAIKELVDKEDIVSADVKGTTARLILTQSGYAAVKKEAAKRRIPLKRLLPEVIYQPNML